MSAIDERLAAAEPASQEIPGPGLLGSLRGLFRFRNDRIAPLQDLTDTYGDVAALRVGKFSFILANSPEVIQECLVSRFRSFRKDPYYDFLRMVLGNGLLTSEDTFHLQQRRMIQPAFHKDRIAQYARIMSADAEALAARWQDGQAVDMAVDMMGLALSIVGKTLFNSEVGGEAHRVAHALEDLLKMDHRIVGPFGKQLIHLPLPSHRRFFAGLRYLDEVLFKMIQEHRASGDQGDLLSMLLAAQDEDDGHRMTDQQVRDEALTLFLAGHETTAVAMTWTWYVLSQHPEVEARLHEELDAVLAGRAPAPEDYPKLDYTRRVFQESMRLYPPAYMIGREAIEDTQLCGYRIPKGAIVIMSPFITQRNPKLWEDPMRFDPDRWLPEHAAGRHKFAYFPFGGGRRLCIGESFAWMEGVLVMAALCQRWRAHLKPGHEIGYELFVTTRPRGGMPMTLEKR